MRRNQRQRAERESAIPQEDVDELVAFILAHPDVGAERARMTLVDQEKALISTPFINDAKKQIAELAESTYRRRREDEKLLEADLRERLHRTENYEHIHASGPHHIWAIDFVIVHFLSHELVLAVVYDVYSQAYIALEVGTACDQTLAVRAMNAGTDNAGTEPALVRRDNGKAFVTVAFAELLANIGSVDAPVPAGKPWFNGSLESNNTSLKAAVKTTALLDLPQRKEAFREARAELPKAIDLLQQTAHRVRTQLNEIVPRAKHRVPPARVLDGSVEENRRRQQAFIEQKRRERTERMDELRRNPEKKPAAKTFIEKVRQTVRKIFGKASTDKLYVLNEALHRRYQAVET